MQSAQCVLKTSKSYLGDADNDSTPLEMHGMTEYDHDMHNMTSWDKEDLARQTDNKLHIVMMDCEDGLGDLVAKTEYLTLDQIKDISSMLGENAVCKNIGIA